MSGPLGPAAARAASTFSRARAVANRQRASERSVRRRRTDWYIDLWTTAAGAIGAEVERVDGAMITVRKGSSVARVERNYTDLDGPLTLRAAGDKALVHETLAAHGLPVPPHKAFDLGTLDRAREFIEEHGRSVVKPAAGTGAGSGVTANITGGRRLRRAALIASGHCERLLIESQVAGLNLRLLVLDGEVLDAVHRGAPTVVGDGQSSLSTLIDRTNETRRRAGTGMAQSLLRRDLDTEMTLAAAGLDGDSIPEPGVEVMVKTVVNDNEISDNVGVLDEIDETAKQMGIDAARVMGTRLAGVDLIVGDHTRPFDAAGGVVLEVNTAPGLFHHQHADVTALAGRILERCLEPSR